MLPLLVRIRHSETGVQYDAGFRRSPVRVGRNQLNDLTIDEGFVSQWHGIVRFDEDGTRFLDVGSTNGTLLDDAPLEKNVETEITEDHELAIGPLRLTLVRMPLDDSQILSRRASAFRLGGASGATGEQSATGTVMLSGGGGDAATNMDMAASLGMTAGAPPRVGAPSGPDAESAQTIEQPPPARASSEGVGAMAKRMAGKMAELNELYRAYDQARLALENATRTTLDGAASPVERDSFASAMKGSFVRALDHREFRAMLGVSTATGGIDAESWLTRLVGPKFSPGLGEPQPAMERAGALLEAFATAYVDMMSGQQQVNSQIEVTTGGEGSPLHEIADARELLAYLLDPHVDPQMRLDDLSRAFADVVMHQLGILNGVIDGAWAIVNKLSPHGVGAVSPGAIAKTSPGFGDYLWPFTAAGNYYRYVSQHLALSNEAQITQLLFGSAFARAYHRVAGSKAVAQRVSRTQTR